MFYPPDVDNHLEMRWVIAIVAASRGNEWMLLFLIVAAIVYALFLFCQWAILKLLEVCRERIAMGGRVALVYRFILAVGFLIGVIGLSYVSNDATRPTGVSILLWDAGLITTAIMALDWYIEQNLPQQVMPELGDATLGQIVAWQNTINAAHDEALAKGK